MTTLQEKLENILKMINEGKEREERDQELRDLIDQFHDINKKIESVLIPGKFYNDIDTSEKEYQEQFKPALNTYLGLQIEIVKEWGEQPDKIDLLDPKELKDGLQELSTELTKLEDSLREHLISTYTKIADEKRTAETISQILPDIKIDLTTFTNAQAYFQKFGRDPTTLASYLNIPGMRSKKIDDWKHHLKAVQKQHEQMDFRKDANLSEEASAFLETLIRSKRVRFTELPPSVVTEINDTFPELSKKLIIRVFQND
jgi:hypothetical protein